MIVVFVVLFLSWFLMRFFMDNANDSETMAYSAVLYSAPFRSATAVDGTGHATLLAQYIVALFNLVLQPVTRLYLIRALVAAQIVIGICLFASAYIWYRRVGLSFFSSLLGLLILSVCVAFARQVRGWELDKLLEPTLYLVAAIAAWDSRKVLFVTATALAALNRETGVLVPLLPLAIHSRYSKSRGRLHVWAAAAIALAAVGSIRILSTRPTTGPPATLVGNLSPDQLVYVAGGLCLMPLLALASLPAASGVLSRLLLVPCAVWIAWILVAERLDQGALLLGPVALVFIPMVLKAIQQAHTSADVGAPAGVVAQARW
jgi:hypothetical protein